MAKTLRTLSDPDFTTKGNTLTFEEGDQNFIDIWNEAKAAVDNLGDLGITATATELNILDGATLSTAELNQLDGNAFTSGITGTTADFSGALDADTLRPDTGKFLSPTSYQFRNAGDTGFRDVEMAALTASQATLSNLTENRVLLAGTSGLVEDDSGLTFDGSELMSTAQIRLPGTGTSDGSEGHKLRFGNSAGAYITRYQAGADTDVQGLKIYTHPSATNADPNQLAVTINPDRSVIFERSLTIENDSGMTIEGTTASMALAHNVTNGSNTIVRGFENNGSRVARENFDASSDEIFWQNEAATNQMKFNYDSGLFSTPSAHITSGAIQADNFTTGSTGWQVSYAGDGEWNKGEFRDLVTLHGDIDPNTNYTSNIGSATKKYLTAHIAELRAEVMAIEERRVTTGGRFNVGLGNVLASDLGSADTTITVEYNNLNSGDIIHLEKVGQVEFISVDSAASGTGPYTYDITRDLDGTGANDWVAGDGVFNTGSSGSGFIDMYAISSLLTGVTTSGPSTAYMERTGSSYNAIDIRALTGNLNGWYGYSSDTFGFAAGDESGDHVTIDPTNGVRFIDGSSNVGAQFSSSLFKIGDNTNYIEYNASTAAFDAAMDSANISAGNLELSANGSSSFLSIGTLTGVSDTTNTGFYVNNSGELLARQDANNYLKVFDDTGTPKIDLKTEVFRLNATNLDINSATPRIDVGSSHFLDGSTDQASFSSGNFLFESSGATFAGTVTMDAGVAITNSGSDYQLTDGGLALDRGTTASSIRFGSGFASTGQIRLNGSDVFVLENTAGGMTVGPTSFDNLNLQSNGSTQIQIQPNAIEFNDNIKVDNIGGNANSFVAFDDPIRTDKIQYDDVSTIDALLERKTISVSDDSAVKIADFSGDTQALLIINEVGQRQETGISFDTSGLNGPLSVFESATFFESFNNAGAPTGTTGADGARSVIIDTTNHDVYIENRSGSTGANTYKYIFIT